MHWANIKGQPILTQLTFAPRQLFSGFWLPWQHSHHLDIILLVLFHVVFVMQIIIQIFSFLIFMNRIKCNLQVKISLQYSHQFSHWTPFRPYLEMFNIRRCILSGKLEKGLLDVHVFPFICFLIVLEMANKKNFFWIKWPSTLKLS